MGILVLIGGGNASGKQTHSRKIKSHLLETIPSIRIKEINLEEEYYNHGLPLDLDYYNFDQLLVDLATFDEDIVIVNGIFALYHKLLRLKLNLKIFIDCDDDTRLIRYIQKNPSRTKEDLATVISNHLLTRSDLYGRTESDIILKTDTTDDTKNKRSIELIMDYLMDLLNNIGIGISDKEEINLRENIDRFYELN